MKGLYVVRIFIDMMDSHIKNLYYIERKSSKNSNKLIYNIFGEELGEDSKIGKIEKNDKHY